MFLVSSKRSFVSSEIFVLFTFIDSYLLSVQNCLDLTAIMMIVAFDANFFGFLLYNFNPS